MPDRKQPNDKPQRKNAIGQIQDQLDRQADAGIKRQNQDSRK